MTTHAVVDKRFARITGWLPAAYPAGENHPSSGFSAVPGVSGPPTGGMEAARSPLSPAAALYAAALGWPVEVQGSDLVVECGEVLDVVAMPIGLAGEVNHLLKVHLMHAPVMEVRGESPSWAFFCAPRLLQHGKRALGTLALHRVTHFGAGDRVPLPPSPTCGDWQLRWVDPPMLTAPTPLPPWVAVASCALRAIQR